MAVTAHVFPQWDQKALSKAVNVGSDTIKCMLLSAYTFANTHATMADVLAAGTELATGNGYTAGGITVSGVSLSTSGLVTTLTATSPVLTVPQGGSLAFAYVVFFDAQGGSNATNFPICYWDLGGTVTFNDTGAGAETVTLTINGSGLATWTTT